jgi:hypothetical protein
VLSSIILTTLNLLYESSFVYCLDFCFSNRRSSYQGSKNSSLLWESAANAVLLTNKHLPYKRLVSLNGAELNTMNSENHVPSNLTCLMNFPFVMSNV